MTELDKPTKIKYFYSIAVVLFGIFATLFLISFRNNLYASSDTKSVVDIATDLASPQFESSPYSLIWMHSNWCSLCSSAENMINSMEISADQLAIYSLDLEENNELSLYTDINAMPVFLVFDNAGKLVNQFSIQRSDDLQVLLSPYLN